MAEKCAFWIPRYRHRQWQPAVDVYRSRHGWLMKCDLAGARREDIQVSVSGRLVTIRGVRRDWNVGEGDCVFLLEIAYSRFERTIRLPNDVEGAAIQLDYRDGMFLIELTTERGKT